jgi:hypothetical protein
MRLAMSKPFSQSLYDSNDAAAKEKLINALLKRGIIAQENPDPYGVDLISMTHPNSYEVEVKHNWTGITFPFQTIHIAARKLKFALVNVRFVILNKPLTHGVVIKGEVVQESAIIKKDTSLTEGEDFISVPIQKAAFVKL